MNSKAYLGFLIALTGAACSVAVATAEPSTAPKAEPDACGAWQHQDLVGKPKSAIPPRPYDANWRVHGRMEPVNQDLRPDRMNIVWDEKTGLIVQVKCY